MDAGALVESEEAPLDIINFLLDVLDHMEAVVSDQDLFLSIELVI